MVIIGAKGFAKEVLEILHEFNKFCLAWCSPLSSQSPRLVFSPSAYGRVSDAS
jgi:hypothetical protein